MTRVSSLWSAPVKRESPSAKAAHTNARFVMLFEPGGRTVASTGPAAGVIATQFDTILLGPFLDFR
jgi:hypothetical protein